MATYQLELIPVTPLHIGSGEELPGYAYFLDDYWYIYSIDRVLGALPLHVRNELVDVAVHNVMALANALADHADILKRTAESIGGYSAEARRIWETARTRRSQALVQRFIHSQNRVYIPGSSLKGALRTALLFGYMRPPARQLQPRANGARDLEEATFRYSGINHDPFRFLKVGDSDVLRDATDLRMAQRYAFQEEEQRWAEQVEILLECTQASLSRLQCTGEEVVLRAPLSVQEDAHAAAASDGANPWRFGVQTLLDACRHFWGQHLAAERNYVTGLPAAEGVYASLADYAAGLPHHAALIRLGFGTGRDSTTVNYAQPRPEVSTSRMLVDGEWPLGWVELRVLTPEGRPFTPADDVQWDVPPIRQPLRRTQSAEQRHMQTVATQRAAAEKAAAAAAHEEERRTNLAGDVLSFLRRKQDDETEK